MEKVWTWNLIHTSCKLVFNDTMCKLWSWRHTNQGQHFQLLLLEFHFLFFNPNHLILWTFSSSPMTFANFQAVGFPLPPKIPFQLLRVLFYRVLSIWPLLGSSSGISSMMSYPNLSSGWTLVSFSPLPSLPETRLLVK